MSQHTHKFGWGATLLATVWFLVHTFVGGAEVATPLGASDLPLAVKAPALMVWHMVTGILALLTLIFAWATWGERADAMLIGTAISAVLAIAGLLSAPLTGAGFALLPQGFLFVPNALLGWLAWRELKG